MQVVKSMQKLTVLSKLFPLRIEAQLFFIYHNREAEPYDNILTSQIKSKVTQQLFSEFSNIVLVLFSFIGF